MHLQTEPCCCRYSRPEAAGIAIQEAKQNWPLGEERKTQHLRAGVFPEPSTVFAADQSGHRWAEGTGGLIIYKAASHGPVLPSPEHMDATGFHKQGSIGHGQSMEEELLGARRDLPRIPARSPGRPQLPPFH